MAKRAPPAKSVHHSVPLPLGQGMCIRVIRILPSNRSDFSNHIACEFSIIDVENKILVNQPGHHSYLSKHFHARTSRKARYQAVSYTWGDASADRTITLDGKLFRVRQNLWDFLDRARKNRVTGYLWIDAMCIDQTNTREKNHQVAIMGKIYSQAKRVVVWLGNCRRHVSRVLGARIEAYRHYDYSTPKEDCEYKSDVIEEFCFLPYWSRAWIVQEYFLAKRKAIWYGRLRIEPNSMEHMIKLWNHTVWSAPYLRNEQVLVVPNSAPAARLLVTQFLRSHDTREREVVRFSTALVLIGLFEHLECADPRDRMYALLSLLGTQQRQDLDVVPDYSKSTTQIFLHVYSRLTHKTNPLRYGYKAENYDNLERMLQPDLQNQTVQLKVLEMRAQTTSCVVDSPFAIPQDHHCGRYTEPHPIITARGCSRCHKKPVMSFQRSVSADLDIRTHFSHRNWKTWVQILLASHNDLDRRLGAQICNDPYFVKLARDGLW